MTELEKMRLAHNYILGLANGVDPSTGEELPNDTCLNNVRLSRCFFYVADILRQVIDNNGNVGKPPRGGEFILTDEFRANLSTAANNLQISEFTKPIAELAISMGMKKIPTTAFTEWLVEQGYLIENVINDKRRKEPSSSGAALGIIAEERTSHYGTYKAILYNPAAQQFMIDNIEKIVERWKNK